MTMLRFKEGVAPKVFHHPIFDALGTLLMVGNLHHVGEVVITSLNDGTHMDGSKHFTDEAFDVRIWNIPNIPQFSADLCCGLELMCPGGYDVVLERDHIHVEFDPK